MEKDLLFDTQGNPQNMCMLVREMRLTGQGKGVSIVYRLTDCKLAVWVFANVSFLVEL